VCTNGSCAQGDCDAACRTQEYPGGYCAARDWAREQCVLGGYSSEVVDIGFQGGCVVPPLLIGSCQCCQSIINTKIDATAYGTNSIFNKSSVTAGEQVAVGGYLRTTGGAGISGKYFSLWDCTGSCVQVTEGGMDSIGPTNSTGYAGKYWAPSNSYEGIKNYVLFFAGDATYNQSQTSAYEFIVFGGAGGFGCTVTCAEQYNPNWTNPYICVYGGPKFAFTTQKVGTVNSGFALINAFQTTDKAECAHQVTEALGWGAGGQACANSRIPSVSNADGLQCAVRDSAYVFPLCDNCWQYGVYDESEIKCITCSGKFENGILGSSLGIYGNPCDGSYTPITGNSLCESACGADQDCDEKSPGEASKDPSYKCDSNCQKESLDEIDPTTNISIKRKSTGLPPAESYLRVDTYTIQFTDSDNVGGSGLKNCNYYINSCNADGTNCITSVRPYQSRPCNGSIDINIGSSPFTLEGKRYLISSHVVDNVDLSGFYTRLLWTDFTPPSTDIE